MPTSPQTWKPSAAHFAGILAEVEKLEVSEAFQQNNQATVAVMPSKAKKQGLLSRIVASIAATPSPMRWTLAIETLALAGLVAVTVLPMHHSLDQGAAYETLSNPEQPFAVSGKQIKLVFADDMTAKELNGLLSQNRLQVREGPTTLGVYVVEMPDIGAEQTLATLKTHPKVRLVLPVNH